MESSNAFGKSKNKIDSLNNEKKTGYERKYDNSLVSS